MRHVQTADVTKILDDIVDESDAYTDDVYVRVLSISSTRLFRCFFFTNKSGSKQKFIILLLELFITAATTPKLLISTERKCQKGINILFS